MKRLRGLAPAPGVVRAPRGPEFHPAPAPAGGPDDGRRGPRRDQASRRSLGCGCHGLLSQGAIFEVQAAIARRSRSRRDAHRTDQGSPPPIGAVQAAAEAFAGQLRALEDELLAARAADVIDVGDRIARLVDQPTVGLYRPAIVVSADDLPPSLTATLFTSLRHRLNRLPPPAYAAIFARAYGIPAVVGVPDLLAAPTAAVDPGGRAELAIDGATGDDSLHLDDVTIAPLHAASAAGRQRHQKDLGEARLSGHHARTGSPSPWSRTSGTPDRRRGDRPRRARSGLVPGRVPLPRVSPPLFEDEQCAAYERAIRPFAPHQVTIRLPPSAATSRIPHPGASRPREGLGLGGDRQVRDAACRRRRRAAGS